MKIGEFIKDYLDRSGLSQAELSRQIGVPASTISSIVNRNNDRVSIDMMLKICKVLNCDINEYIDSLREENVLEDNKKITAPPKDEAISKIDEQLNVLNDDELDKLFDYVKFLLWLREQS